MTDTARTVELIVCDVICDHGLDVGDISTIEAVMQQIADGATLSGLGMDGVDVLEVIHRVEREFSIHLPDDAVTEESRAADIREIVSDLLVEKAQREARAESISQAWHDWPADEDESAVAGEETSVDPTWGGR